MIAAFMAVNTYLIDAFTLYAASAIAANTILRSVREIESLFHLLKAAFQRETVLLTSTISIDRSSEPCFLSSACRCTTLLGW